MKFPLQKLIQRFQKQVELNQAEADYEFDEVVVLHTDEFCTCTDALMPTLDDETLIGRTPDTCG